MQVTPWLDHAGYVQTAYPNEVEIEIDLSSDQENSATEA